MYISPRSQSEIVSRHPRHVLLKSSFPSGKWRELVHFLLQLEFSFDDSNNIMLFTSLPEEQSFVLFHRPTEEWIAFLNGCIHSCIAMLWL